MCDTLFASAHSTRDRYPIFGKNSDRQRNEAQVVGYFPRACYPAGAQLKCTYLTIPQSSQTHAALLCRPFWGWGAEMGANEQGVVIGNEGLHARGPAPEREALTGMDLVRLALERAASARAAVTVITELLERYGQGGNCGHVEPSYYHNGFLIADPTEAYVLETVNSEWILEQVHGIRTMSNIYSVGHDAARISGGVPDLLQAYGWNGPGVPDYAAVIANPNREHIGQARARRQRSSSLLQTNESHLHPAALMAVLRDHGPPDLAGSAWHPGESPHISLCMHAGAADRPGQTVGSLVTQIRPDGPINWVTATSAACISIFKPVLMNSGVPDQGPPPTDRFDPSTLWWGHEVLHRSALAGDFPQLLRDIAPERDALEAEFQRSIEEVLNGGDLSDRGHVVRECWRKATQTQGGWLSRVRDLRPVAKSRYLEAWREMSGLAQMNE
jgi:secernin